MKDIYTFERFVKTIEHNPNPTYLKAVKSIQIRDPKDTRYERSHIQSMIKTLFRFPNLEKVLLYQLRSILNAFDNDICKELLEYCPKLNTFEIEWDNYGSYDNERTVLSYRVAPLLTRINLDKLAKQPPCIEQFMANFPRMQIVDGGNDNLNTMAKWLPVLVRMHNLKKFGIQLQNDDQEYIAEEYFMNTTKEEKNQLIERLSNVKSLQLSHGHGIFPNTLNFVNRYMTGLDTLCIKYGLGSSTINLHQKRFLDNTLDLVKSVNSCNIYMYMRLNALPVYISVIAHDHLSRDYILTFQAANKLKDPDIAIVNIKAEHGGQKEMRITVVDSYPLCALVSNMDTIVNVDELRLMFKNHMCPLYVNTYEAILERVTPLKSVVLTVPSTFKETSARPGKVHSQVQQVTIQATFNGEFEPLLDMCYLRFPNMRHLSLYYFNGIWNKQRGDFRIDLPQYTLERLTVDTTPVKKLMVDHLWQLCTGNAFFVVEVKYLENCKRQAYKVSFDLKSITRITHFGDLFGYERNRDYLRIHIVISTLQQLELCMNRDNSLLEYDYFENPKYLARRTIELQQSV